MAYNGEKDRETFREEIFMNTKDMLLAFTLEEEGVTAALIDEEGKEALRAFVPLEAQGPAQWESGLQEAFAGLGGALEAPIRDLRGLVIHDRLRGFLALDRTWQALGAFRNAASADTAETAAYLTGLFEAEIGADSVIAHLLYAMRQGEAGLDAINYAATAGTWLGRRLTGSYAADRADAWDIFPLTADGEDYDSDLQARFNALVEADGYPWRLQHLLPEIREAGEPIGSLTPEGAFFIDPSCRLHPGAPVLA